MVPFSCAVLLIPLSSKTSPVKQTKRFSLFSQEEMIDNSAKSEMYFNEIEAKKLSRIFGIKFGILIKLHRSGVGIKIAKSLEMSSCSENQ